MFGYVKNDAPELLVREQEYYKAIYCGLCRAQGHCTGQCSRLTLSYDFTFLLAVRMALSGEKPFFDRKACPAHPLRKRLFCRTESQTEFVSYAAAILNGLKCRDDLHDERGWKKCRVFFAWCVIRHGYRKAARRYPALVARAEELMRELSHLENEKAASVDRPAEISGELLALFFAEGLDGAAGQIGHAIGRHTGILVYLLDALDDWEGDLQHGRYNPLSCLYPDHKPGDADVTEALRNDMGTHILGLESAMDLMDFDGRDDLRGIIANIVRLGLPRQIERVCAKTCQPERNEKGGAEHD